MENTTLPSTLKAGIYRFDCGCGPKQTDHVYDEDNNLIAEFSNLADLFLFMTSCGAIPIESWKYEVNPNCKCKKIQHKTHWELDRSDCTVHSKN